MMRSRAVGAANRPRRRASPTMRSMWICIPTGRRSAASGWQRLIDQLEKRLRQPRCGIMIHHQRMNDAAFCFLDTLLGILRQQSRLHMADMRDLPT